MDFDFAAQRLAREQSQLKGRRRQVEVSAKASREVQLRKKQQQHRAAERLRKRQQEEYAKAYFHKCERDLGVKSLSNTGPLRLRPTSIHGEGDKISLPPSVLEFLTQQLTNDRDGDAAFGSPWTFRIGIPNAEYNFPASLLLQSMKVSDDASEEMEDDDDDNTTTAAPYLDELRHKYLSYTHATVVEFTQEEGHVGLPSPISSALLSQSTKEIAVTRTMDPAGGADEHDDNNDMDVDDEEKTPGHVAWGAFDVPDEWVEVSLVKLPKGKACTLKPTEEALKNGFYNLKDIKLVLEQSLVRTRATLSVGDVVHTWHRGVRFDLSVSSVSPAIYNSVLCINTDIEVEFEAAAVTEEAVQTTEESKGSVLSAPAGRTLSDATPSLPANTQGSTTAPLDVVLLPEPPVDRTEGVCTVQLRGDATNGRRRFDVNLATVKDLMDFAISLGTQGGFRLVTRFPRRVLDDDKKTLTLKEAGVQPGQELLMVEKIG